MENKEFSYGAMAVPSSEATYRLVRWGWGGLNRTDVIDSGDITDCDGVNIHPPYVDAAASFLPVAQYEEPVGIYGFDDFLLVLYRAGGKIRCDIRRGEGVYTGIIGDALGTDADFVHRSVVQFNVAEGTENIVSASFRRKLLVFPDRVSLDFDISASGFTAASLGSTYPSIKYATVYGSRLFGVDDNLVYASSYNDYADWDLDTADETSDANAWVSMSQSNARADGVFTGIWTYDNHVVLFKRDFTQLVYNNKNPFRIVDVTAYGAVSQRAIAEAEGVLYFASPDMVYAFTGGIPKAIGDELSVKDYRDACMGSYKDSLYLCTAGTLFRYRDGVWSQRLLSVPAVQFAGNENGLYALLSDGEIVMVDGEKFQYGGEGGEYGDWWFETDFMAAGRLDIRRARKITVLCEIAEGASVEVYLLRDGEKFSPESSLRVLSSHGHGWRTLSGLIRGMSADFHRMRFAGHGKVRVHAAELHIAWGGGLYKER
jgi:hypothetical protein